MTTDLTTQTPLQIDTAIAEIMERAATPRSRQHSLLASARKYRKAGGNYIGIADRKEAEAAEFGRQAQEIEAEATPLHEEYDRRGRWSRYFLCTSSNDGHIHRGRECSTLHATSTLAWLPELADKTEAEMVEAHGSRVCTVCYPSAPTMGAFQRDLAAKASEREAKDAALCPGSGQQALNQDFRYYTPRGQCPHCKQSVTPTSTGKVRKHKAPEAPEAPAAAPAESSSTTTTTAADERQKEATMAKERTAEQKAAHAAKERARRAAKKAAAAAQPVLLEGERPSEAAMRLADAETAKPKAKRTRRTPVQAAAGDGQKWPLGEKVCPKCGETKPRSEFASNVRTADGAYYICKACGTKARAAQKAARLARQGTTQVATVPASKAPRGRRVRADLPLATTAEDFNPVPEGMKATVVSRGRQR